MQALIKTLGRMAMAMTTLASTHAYSQVPDYVRIRSIAYAGSGCPAGTVAQNVSRARDAFTLLFDSFVAQIGAFIPPSESRKNCAVNIDLDFPQGWSFTIVGLDYRGYYAIDRGIAADQVSHYYFQGERQQATLSSTYVGPRAGDYLHADTVGLEVWSPCGAAKRSLNVNAQVRLRKLNPSANNAQGLITVDSIDGNLTQIYYLKWRRC